MNETAKAQAFKAGQDAEMFCCKVKYFWLGFWNIFLCVQDRLLVSGVTANSCKLTWAASKNSGGLALEYLVEKCHVGSSDSWVKQAVTSNTHLTINDLGICQ